jgi:polysaccharide export outer membrane protein
VDWRAITEGGSTATNYQLLPGDRVYVAGGPWVCFDNAVAQILSVLERVLGLTLLPKPSQRQPH